MCCCLSLAWGNCFCLPFPTCKRSIAALLSHSPGRDDAQAAATLPAGALPALLALGKHGRAARWLREAVRSGSRWLVGAVQSPTSAGRCWFWIPSACGRALGRQGEAVVGREAAGHGWERLRRPLAFSSAEPQLYQEIRERGLNSVSHESDEDLLEESIPEEPSPPGAAIVVQSYRPAQVTWSQLPEVGAAAQPGGSEKPRLPSPCPLPRS